LFHVEHRISINCFSFECTYANIMGIFATEALVLLGHAPGSRLSRQELRYAENWQGQNG
jgi:hypothetical protein